MRRASIVYAKNHFSELVDLAEHKSAKILICRHGKPAAALVPVDLVEAKTKAPRRVTTEELAAMWDAFDAEPIPAGASAVDELELGRSRLDRMFGVDTKTVRVRRRRARTRGK